MENAYPLGLGRFIKYSLPYRYLRCYALLAVEDSGVEGKYTLLVLTSSGGQCMANNLIAQKADVLPSALHSVLFDTQLNTCDIRLQ